ncbi:MAG: hypothetical protein ACOYNL_02975 [Rickettsiales bacterium]
MADKNDHGDRAVVDAPIVPREQQLQQHSQFFVPTDMSHAAQVQRLKEQQQRHSHGGPLFG